MQARENYHVRDCTGPTTQAACKQQISDFERRLCYYHTKLADSLMENAEGVEVDPINDPDE